jgi:cytoskeletal protein CcmA (bactofilin family)
MALFGRKIPSKVMPGNVEPKESPSPAARARKEMIMKNEPNGHSSLLQELSPKRRLPGEDVAPGAQPAAGAAGAASETVISGDTVFEGKALSQGELRINGTFKGEIVSNNRVIVGTAGKLEATVEAKAMVISGRVVGNLRIQERLELLSTGELYGDLETQPGALIIEKGARLEGRCSMGLAEPKKEALSVQRQAMAQPTGRSAQPAPAQAAQRSA